MRDFGINPLPDFHADLFPVFLRRCSSIGEIRHECVNLAQRKAEILHYHDEGQATEIRSREPPLAAAVSIRANQSFALVETDRADGQACSRGESSN